MLSPPALSTRLGSARKHRVEAYKRLNALVATAILIVGLGAPTLAGAAMIEYQILVDGVNVGSGSSTSGQILNVNGSSPLFSTLNIGTVTGTPVVPSPGLVSWTTSISTSANFGSTHTVEIDITQVDLTSLTGFLDFTNAMSLNNLINVGNGAGVTASYSNYVDPNDVAYSKTDSVATLMGLAKASSSNGAGADAWVDVGSQPYSETQVLFATFTGSNETLSATDQMTGTDFEPWWFTTDVGDVAYVSEVCDCAMRSISLAEPVPEPGSLVILGAALSGLVFLRRRR